MRAARKCFVGSDRLIFFVADAVFRSPSRLNDHFEKDVEALATAARSKLDVAAVSHDAELLEPPAFSLCMYIDFGGGGGYRDHKFVAAFSRGQQA